MQRRQQVGFIGLGAMGSGMARNLLAKGFPLTVLGHRNRRPVEALIAQGASEAGHPAELARKSDVVFVCVGDSAQVESVVYGKTGLMSAARPGLVIVDTTTSDPAATARIHADFKGVGADFVDAPLGRTPREAAEGRLNVMVGAEPAVLARLRPLFEAFAENVIHVGGPGAGHKVKLLYNFIALGQIALIAEALVAGARAGVDLDAFCRVVGAGGPNSAIFQAIAPAAIAGRYDAIDFGLVLARKDMRYYTQMTTQLGLPGSLGQAVHQSFVLADALGFGGERVGALVAALARMTETSVGSD